MKSSKSDDNFAFMKMQIDMAKQYKKLHTIKILVIYSRY